MLTSKLETEREISSDLKCEKILDTPEWAIDAIPHISDPSEVKNKQ